MEQKRQILLTKEFQIIYIDAPHTYTLKWWNLIPVIPLFTVVWS